MLSDAQLVVDWLISSLTSIYTFMMSTFLLQVVLGLIFLPKIIQFFRKILGN